MAGPSRRDLLLGLGATGVAASCDGGTVLLPEPVDRGAPSFPWTGAMPPDGSVPHAAVGDPTPSGLRLVARSNTPNVSVRIATWQSSDWTERDAIDMAIDEDGYGAIELTDLPADTAIAWQVVTDTGGSEVGHARTAPAPDAAVPLRLMVSCCADHSHGDFPALVTGVDRGPVDLYLGLGDTIYCDGCYGLNTYRARWNRAQGTVGYRHLFDNVAVAMTWDDHEVADGWSGDTVDPVQLDNGRRSMLEALPIRPGGGGELWRTLSYGRTADIFLVDNRSERDRDAGEFISAAQLDWLIRGVQGSTATWKIVCVPTPVSELPSVFASPLAVDDTWKSRSWSDQRRAFLDALAGVSGVLILSGDHHFPAVSRVDPDGPAGHVWELLTGPLGSNRPPVYETLERTEDLPWFAKVWCAHRIELGANGYASVTIVGEDDETWFEGIFHADDGLLGWSETPDPDRPDG